MNLASVIKGASLLAIWSVWLFIAANMLLLWLIGDGWASQTATASDLEQIALTVICIITGILAIVATIRIIKYKTKVSKS